MNSKLLKFEEFVNEKYDHRFAQALNEADPAAPAPAATGATPPAADPAAATTIQAKPLTVNLSSNFPSGKWKLDDQQSAAVKSALGQIAQYMQTNKGTGAFDIAINSGESQVPNRDADAPKGPDGQFPKLEVGQLASNRANVVKGILDQYLADLKAKGVDTSKIKVTINKPAIGATPWKEGANPADPAYTKEQFVTVSVNGSAASGQPGGGGSPFSEYAMMGESIFHANKSIAGTIHYKAAVNRQSVNTAQQDSLVRLTDRNGKYTNRAVPVPAADFQKFFGTTNTIQDDAAWDQYAQQHGQDVPATDPFFNQNVNSMANRKNGDVHVQ